jgi:hypothetical protein
LKAGEVELDDTTLLRLEQSEILQKLARRKSMAPVMLLDGACKDFLTSMQQGHLKTLIEISGEAINILTFVLCLTFEPRNKARAKAREMVQG